MKLLAPIVNDDDIVNKKYVDSIDIGSRNIVTGTDTMIIGSINQATWKNRQWRQSGTGTIETIDITETLIPSVNKGVKLTASSTEQIGICQDLIPLNNNNIYTLSCWVRGSSSGLTCKLQPFYASSTDTGGIKSFTLAGEWQYISYTTNKTPQNTTNYSGAYIYLIPNTSGDTLEVCGIKLERGDKATDWSPAPEDTDTKVTSKTENPESTFTYYPTWVTGATTGEVLVNDGIRYATLQGTTDTNGYGILTLGNSRESGTTANKYGAIRLYSTDAYFGQIAQIAGLTTNVTHALPTTGGTILNTGTTSFTQSLTSGTAVGTLKINGTNITLYAPTNTDTKVTQTITTSNASYPLLLAPKGQTATATTTAYFDSGVTLNPSTNTIAANISGSSASCTGNAATATKLATSAGSATQPVYYSDGKPVSCTYTLGKSVPSDAVFTDTKVASKTENPTEQKPYYYPTWVTGATTGEALINNGIRYATIEGTDSRNGYGIFILGNNTSSGSDGNKYGAIRIYSTGSYYGQIAQINGTSNVNHSLPATSGTILNTGTTSFTPALTSGTAIGTLKINNTSTTLYAPDNYLPLAGGTVTGTLVLSKTTDTSDTADNSPALIIGNTDSVHLEFDTTNIMVKSPEAIPSVLTLNHDGGDVYIGKRGTGNLIGVCQDVISGTILNEEPGMGTDVPITFPSNRTKAIIEVRYSTSHSQTVYINNLNTAIPPTTLLGSSTTYYVKYSVATNGTITITLINNQAEGSSQRYSIKYMVTYFN